jgi:hypothetical protein
MAFRTGVAANIHFGGRWRFGGPPTQAGDAISCGVRQLIPGRVLLSNSDKRSSETRPTNYCHQNRKKRREFHSSQIGI